MTEALLVALRASLTEAGLWRPTATLLAAVSGGADSVALLYALTLAQKEAKFSLEACHVQHGLRGEASLADQRFVEALCAQWNVPLRVMQAELDLTMDSPGVETLARERRRELFSQCMEACQADGLLLAHHRDDQAETVLMRLCRGAGLKGLCGVSPASPFGRGVMLRPFLNVSKRELEAVVLSLGCGFRLDESNSQACTPRNALRLNVLPRLESLFPGAAEHIAQAAESLRTDEACLEALSRQLYQQCLWAQPPVFALRLNPLRDAPLALRLRALRRLYREGLSLTELAPEERELSREDSLALAALPEAPPQTALNLPCGLTALRGHACLFLKRQSGAPLQPAQPAAPLGLNPKAGRYTLSGLTVAIAPPGDASPPPPTNAAQAFIDPKRLNACVLRTPKPDDRFHPLGAPGSKPLRRYLTDRKLDAPFREILPVLAQGREVLWIPGLATSEALRQNPNEAQWRLAVQDNPLAWLFNEKE